MKKQFTLVTGLLLGIFAQGNAQTTHYTEDFEGSTVPAVPTGWTTELPSGSTAAGWVTANAATTFASSVVVPAHTKYAVVNDITANSNNTGSRLVSPVYDLSAYPNAVLKFKKFFVGGYLTANPNTKERLIVQVTPDGTTWSNIDTVDASGGWDSVQVSLTGYTSATTQIAFYYTDAASNMFGAAIDDVELYTPANANDLELTDVTPAAKSPLGYGLINSTKTLGGTVYNSGYLAVTSFKISYKIGSTTMTDVISGVNIKPFKSYDFTMTTPITIPATTGEYPVDMWIELTGDADATNDTAETTIGAASFLPKKKIFIEEGTGTWCGWCPRGAVYMEDAWANHAENFSLVAAHNGDPMTIASYDSYLTSNFIDGFPSMVIDRTLTTDPSALPQVYDEMKDYFGFADITVNGPTVLGENFYVGVKVKPAIDLNGTYKLGLIITEDDVNKADGGSDWDQTNYYAGGSRGAMGGYENLPAHVPAKDMHYQFVARKVVPSPTGQSNSLPASMTAGNSYDYTFTTTLDPSWNKNKLRAVVFLLRGSDNTVLNSNYYAVNLGVTDVNDNVSGVKLFPNPAAQSTNVRFNLANTSNVQIVVTDMMGRAVYTSANQMNAGAQTVNISTANFAAGLYNVKIETEQGSVTQRLSVVK